MLVLTRKLNERIIIDDITVMVVEIRDGTVRLGIEAPRSIAVHREAGMRRPGVEEEMSHKPYHEWMHDEGEKMRAEQRAQEYRLQHCEGCGVAWRDHVGVQTLCSDYRELMQLVVDWHLGGDQALARLRDAADKEIERRQRKT